MSKSRPNRKKYIDLKKQQSLYFDFLTKNEDPLRQETGMRIINEITRIGFQLKELERLTLLDLQKPVSEWELELNSKLNRK